MLHLNRGTGQFQDRLFTEFPDLLRADDLVVFNNTRVFPARLYGTRSGTKAQPVSMRNPAAREFLRGRVEVLLTRQLSPEPNEWECLVRPGRKIGIGEHLFFEPVQDPEHGEQQRLEAKVSKIARATRQFMRANVAQSQPPPPASTSLRKSSRESRSVA